MSDRDPITILIDGGGTTTDVAVVRSNVIIARTRLASFKPDDRSDHLDELCRNVGGWLASQAPQALVPRFVLIGMSGVWGEHEKQTYLNGFTDAWMTYVSIDVPRASIVSDVELVHLAAFGTQDGVILIAGTGSIAVAHAAQGRSIRVGGWGPRVDDAGGGFWLGREALRAVARSLDGRAPETLLIRPVAAFLRTNAENHESVAAALRRTPVDRAARLAEAVLTYADDGDMVARELRDSTISALVSLIPPIDAVMPKPLAIALHGSLFKHESFRVQVTEWLQEQHPDRPVQFVEDVLLGIAETLPGSDVE